MDRRRCKDILKKIPNVNSPVGGENRLIHAAVVDGEVDGVQFLLKKGANAKIPSQIGMTALDLAHYLGHEQLYALLGEADAPAIKVQLKGEELRCMSGRELGAALGFRYLYFQRFEDYPQLENVHELCAYSRDKGYMHTERVYLGMTYSKEIASGELADISVRWIDDALGHGLFAEAYLPRWTLVGVYAGVVSRRPWLGTGMGDYTFRYPIGELYPKRYVIDAEKEGNALRFMNHSDDPNCSSIACFYKGIMHLVVF
ncbi:MAG: SET domain-containing protein-lysine N-methyltransferase, partial [Chlamydiia bacterium]|nr:SET domain-containing protein-lysine N-methyltransferase [Chlamydiia bacterium]